MIMGCSQLGGCKFEPLISGCSSCPPPPPPPFPSPFFIGRLLWPLILNALGLSVVVDRCEVGSMDLSFKFISVNVSITDFFLNTFQHTEWPLLQLLLFYVCLLSVLC